MIVATVSKGSISGLPQSLKAAQAAIHLPEVQQMLRQLSKHKLGIFMPHMHGQQTGEFRSLPDDVIQVESGLEVSFRSTEEIVKQTDRFLPVGWCWREGAATPVAVSEMDDEEEEREKEKEKKGDTRRIVKHKLEL